MKDPAETLAAGMRRVGNGRFDTQLPACDEEPFRSIYHDFNQMSEKLLGVEALRESFVSNVAHEFKTPLTYIQGYATLLQDEELSAATRANYVDLINEATRHLANMIGNLLEISDISRPNAKLETQTFSLDEQLRHVMALFIPEIARRGLNYDVNFETVDIEGNESLLTDAWTNLISNALKYTSAGGMIAVALAKRGESAIVRVSDTGCGMTESQVEHAFDRFYQGERSPLTESSGLGLAIVHAVVKKHDGRVSIETAPDRGTTFVVELPLEQTDQIH